MQLARDPSVLATEFVDLALGMAVFVIAAAVIYLPGRYVLVPAASRAMDAIGVEDTWSMSIAKLLNAGFGLFAVLTAANLSGFTSFLQTTEAVAAAATIALGFAAQDVLSNFVSGAIIVVDPQYKIGDWIQWDDTEGVIEDIGFRVTRVHTFDNELITVPNAELTKNAVTNPVAKDALRVRQTFCVAYDTDLDRAKALLVDVVRGVDGVSDRPAPGVRVVELAPSCVELETRFWITHPGRVDFVAVRSTVAQAVLEQFDEAGIEMPYPTRELRGRLETVRGDDSAPAGTGGAAE